MAPDRQEERGARSGDPPPAPRPAPETVAVIDMGAASIRLVIAQIAPDRTVRVVEQASRGVLLGKDTFTDGRIGATNIEAALAALEGFRRIMDSYGISRYRAVGTSAVRESANRDAFLDRIKLRTGLDVEVIDGPEQNRLTYTAVRESLRDHEALGEGDALLVEVGGGSADISLLKGGEPVRSGSYALGSIRMRQRLSSWRGAHDRGILLLRRHIHNVVEDVRREIPLEHVRHFIALGGDARFAASRLAGEAAPSKGARSLERDAFLRFCEDLARQDPEELAESHRLPPAEAETLVPALLTYQELLAATSARSVIVPDASLRAGLLLELSRPGEELGEADLRRQALASAETLGEKYRYDAAHARTVARLATRIFDDLQTEHGLSSHSRLLLEVAALLHDIGIFVGIRAHHKHSQYVLSVSEIFGLSQNDMAVVANVARYHRRATPQKSHATFTRLDREDRVEVSKLAAILRLANALDADHLQKVRDVRIGRDDDPWILEVHGAGDLTMERLATMARADLFMEVFGRRLTFREAEPRA